MMKAAFEQIHKVRYDTIIMSALWNGKNGTDLHRSILNISGMTDHVIVIGPSMRYKADLPELIAKSDLAGRDLIEAASLYKSVQWVQKKTEEAVSQTNATFVPLLPVMCPEGRCITLTDEGVPMLSDFTHFTFEGSKEIVRRLRESGFQIVDKPTHEEPEDYAETSDD